MRMYYACRDLYNAGDYIGPYLYHQITGLQAEWSDNKKAKHLIVCGSVLQHASNRSIVLGAGFGAEGQVMEGKPKLLIVRGELTSQRLIDLGFRKTWELGDPGLFLPYVYKPQIEKKYKLGVLPHYIDKPLVDSNEHHIIDIQKPVQEVIVSIMECEKIISSSLHGLIIAHAYGVPATWVEFSDNVVGGGFKFRDYFSTVDIEPYSPINCRDGVFRDIWYDEPQIPRNRFRRPFNVLKRAVS